MANITTEKMIDLIPGMPVVETMFPIQDDDSCYQGVLVTLDSNGYVGTFATTERVAGLCFQTTKNTDENHSAAREGYDVHVLVDCYVRWYISGATHADVGRAVFAGADNATLSFTPRAKGYLGKVVAIEAGTGICVIHVENVGSDSWDSFFDLADDGTVDLPDAQAAIVQVQGGGEYGIVEVTAAGACSVAATASASANFDVADTDAKLCLFDGGTAATVKNRLGSTTRVHVTYNGAPTS